MTDEHPTERTLRVMREEWEAPLLAEIKRLRTAMHDAAESLEDWDAPQDVAIYLCKEAAR